jgi:hypothetical protein
VNHTQLFSLHREKRRWGEMAQHSFSLGTDCDKGMGVGRGEIPGGSQRLSKALKGQRHCHPRRKEREGEIKRIFALCHTTQSIEPSL